jgi:hypothetical protein
MVMTVVPGLSEAAWATAMQAISPSEASAFATSTSTWPPAGRSCRRCYINMNKKPCARCGQARKIVARRNEGGICHVCYRTDPQVVEECAGCGRVKRPAVRRPDGTALCESCWRPPVRTCSSCGVERPASLGTGGAYCNTCYRRLHQPRRTCGRCGLARPIAVKATAGSPGLCYNCSGLLPPAPCTVCGKTKPGYNHAVQASSAGPADHTTKNPPTAASSDAFRPAGLAARSAPAATCRS